MESNFSRPWKNLRHGHNVIHKENSVFVVGVPALLNTIDLILVPTLYRVGYLLCKIKQETE